MTRTKLLSAALAVMSVLCAGLHLRESGLFQSPLAALAAMPHGVWIDLSSEPQGSFTRTLDGGRIEWRGEYGNVVDNMIFHFGLYERAECLLLRDLVQEVGGAYLDVGANFGNHALFVSQYAEAVHAVEPWPPALDRLRELKSSNRADNVFIHPVGYSNEPGTLPFYPPPEGSFVIGSFDPTFNKSDDHPEPQLLPLVAADQHLAEVGAGRIGVVTCDIEGFERYAFEGMRETLRRDRPVVMFEVNQTEGGFRTLDQLTATFPENYRFYEIRLEGPWMIWTPFGTWFFGSEGTGRYQLVELRDLDRTNALAVPAERQLAVLPPEP